MKFFVVIDNDKFICVFFQQSDFTTSEDVCPKFMAYVKFALKIQGVISTFCELKIS